MNLFRIMFRNIDRGFAVLENFATVIRRGSFISTMRTGHSAANDIEMQVYGNDDELDLHQALEIDPIGNAEVAYRTRRPTYLATVIRYIREIEMPTFPRPRCIRRLNEWTSASIVLLVLCFLVFGKWDTKPLESVSIPDLYKENLENLHNKTSEWFGARQNKTGLYYSDPIIAPGFYLVPAAEAFPDVWRTAIQSSTAGGDADAPGLPDSTHSDRFTLPSTLEKRYSDDKSGPFHHAYPIHAGRIDRSPQALRIKLELEHCAEGILKKLKGEVLEITPGFEFALHDCKSAIDFALDNLYPPHVVSITSRSAVKRSLAVCGVVPRQNHNEVTQCTNSSNATFHAMPSQAENFSSKSERSTCSENFCDWISPSNLDRCYRRDDAEYHKSGKVRYTNDSADDFKDDAPLECNLCLPEIDHEEIQHHCKEVEATEIKILYYLLIALSILGIITTAGIAIKMCWAGYNKSTRNNGMAGLARRRTRVPVMPAARASSVSVRGGRVDKRTISYPVLIPRPAEELEGAFENPRPAPSPLK